MAVNINIPELGNRFVDYRNDIPGDSYNWGPVINAGQVKYFALHHSVTPQTAKNDGNWKKEADLIANLHLGQGWGGIGYRFVICSNGVVAYVGDLSHGGSAVANHNHEIFSAVMVGDFTKYLPTDMQIHSAYDLVKHFLEKEPNYPLIDSWDDLIGHKDASKIWNEPQFATACPGTSWPNDMRWRVINNVPYTPQPTPTPPAPPTPTPPAPPPPSDQCKVEKARILELEIAIEKLKIDMRNAIALKEKEKLDYKKKVDDLAKQIQQLA